MLRLIAATLAAVYCILLLFGDATRRPAEVARAEPIGLTLIDVSQLPEVVSGASTYVSEVSDREAVLLSIAAAEKHREERRASLVEIRTAHLNEAVGDTLEAVSPAPDYWYVTGSRVNLRNGPGTDNPVVGQVTWGTEAEVLADRKGWYQIRLDGSVTGWISGRFLAEKMPG